MGCEERRRFSKLPNAFHFLGLLCTRESGCVCTDAHVHTWMDGWTDGQTDRQRWKTRTYVYIRVSRVGRRGGRRHRCRPCACSHTRVHVAGICRHLSRQPRVLSVLRRPAPLVSALLLLNQSRRLTCVQRDGLDQARAGARDGLRHPPSGCACSFASFFVFVLDPEVAARGRPTCTLPRPPWSCRARP